MDATIQPTASKDDSISYHRPPTAREKNARYLNPILAWGIPHVNLKIRFEV